MTELPVLSSPDNATHVPAVASTGSSDNDDDGVLWVTKYGKVLSLFCELCVDRQSRCRQRRLWHSNQVEVRLYWLGSCRPFFKILAGFSASPPTLSIRTISLLEHEVLT
jgi:hypothetical protein